MKTEKRSFSSKNNKEEKESLLEYDIEGFLWGLKPPTPWWMNDISYDGESPQSSKKKTNDEEHDIERYEEGEEEEEEVW
jgi:hypothetical protein